MTHYVLLVVLHTLAAYSELGVAGILEKEDSAPLLAFFQPTLTVVR